MYCGCDGKVKAHDVGVHSTCQSSSPATAPELLAQIPRDALAHPVNATTSVMYIRE